MRTLSMTFAALIITIGAGIVGIAAFSVGSGLGGILAPQAQAQAGPQDTNREQYIKQSEQRFEDWGQKIDDFNAKPAQRGAELREKTKREIDQAWSETKAGWAKLKSAGKDGWEDAKEAFEASWRKLERAWKDVQS